MNDSPSTLPVAELLSHAFSLGLNAVDTSPYYGPSEVLLGKALRHSTVSKFPRSSYTILTKAGRQGLSNFDYTPSGIRSSVLRSISRLSPGANGWVDVVFLHDIEFVTLAEVLAAFGELVALQSEGKVRYLGLSGYPPQRLFEAAMAVRRRYGKPMVDIVQSYAHYNLQNRQLVEEGWLRKLKEEAGVEVVLNASPLGMKLLSGGLPGEFHPAPKELQEACIEAARRCEALGTKLPKVAMKWAFANWGSGENKRLNGGGKIVSGVSFVEELLENVEAFRSVMKDGETSASIRSLEDVDENKVGEIAESFLTVENLLGNWIGYEWESPPKGWFEERSKLENKAKL